MERTTPEILEALRASEEFKTRMIECSRDCIKVLDLDGRLLSMNAGGMEVLEICDLAPFLNSSWIDFWQGEDRERARAAVEAARAGRVGRFVGYFPGQQTGKPMWWDVVVNAILDAEGRPERLLALSRDATDLKRAEEVLRKANEELERRVQERTADLAQANAALRESEARYRGLYENAPISYVGYDAQRCVQHVNPAFIELSGFSEAEVRGLSYTTLAPAPEWAERYRETFDTAEQHGVAVVEVQGQPRDGRLLWLQATVRAVRDPDGRLQGFYSLAADVTSMKEAERALRESESLYRDLYEHAPLAYFTFGTDGIMRRWNARGPEITGYSDAELRGMNTLDFHTDIPENHAAFERLEREVFRNGKDLVEEVQGRRKDGTTYWARVYLSPLRDAAGGVVGARSIAEDITELRRAQAAVRENEARLGAIIDSALDAIIVIDDEAVIRLFNPAAESVFRCAAADAVGTPVARFSTPASAESLRQAWADIRAGVKPFSITEPGLKSRRADGEEFEFEGTLSCAQVGGQRIWTITIRDLDERRQLEAEQSRLKLQSAYLQEEIKATHNFEEIVGQSRALTAVLGQVELVAATGSTVLVLGETGTGKELVARAIHSRGTRRDRPLIKVNCGALPGGLIESELFGHERGAFTGAADRRIGRFELAHGGTIFLDELGDMPPEVQVKLLRVLQEQEFERVGGSTPIKADVRVIAATNRDLTKAVAERKFRQDLYYRLNVFPVHLPPLRERVDDIPLLVHFFVARYAAKIGRSISRVPQDTMRRFMTYNWPGNVRELENVIERAVILSAGPDLNVPAEMLATLPAAQPRTIAPPPVEAPAPAANATGLKELERTHILSVLKRTNWRIDGPQGAAGILKMNPSTLRSRMKKLGIQRNADVVS